MGFVAFCGSPTFICAKMPSCHAQNTVRASFHFHTGLDLDSASGSPFIMALYSFELQRSVSWLKTFLIFIITFHYQKTGPNLLFWLVFGRFLLTINACDKQCANDCVLRAAQSVVVCLMHTHKINNSLALQLFCVQWPFFVLLLCRFSISFPSILILSGLNPCWDFIIQNLLKSLQPNSRPALLSSTHSFINFFPPMCSQNVEILRIFSALYIGLIFSGSQICFVFGL